MASSPADLGTSLPLLTSGKVRELYEVDAKALLFVASDRISAYDVIMKNVSRCSAPISSFTDLHRVCPTKAKS